MIKVFVTNESGKIEFTKEELEKLLREVDIEAFERGKQVAKSPTVVWTSPQGYGQNIKYDGTPSDYSTTGTFPRADNPTYVGCKGVYTNA